MQIVSACTLLLIAGALAHADGPTLKEARQRWLRGNYDEARAYNYLLVQAHATQATGTAEPATATTLAEALGGARRKTVGADKAYDTRDFVAAIRAANVTPHVAQNTSRRHSAIDSRTTRHPGYAISQRARKRVEEIFGWLKTVGLMRKLRHRGLDRVDWMFVFVCAAYNLVRIRNLTEATG